MPEDARPLPGPGLLATGGALTVVLLLTALLAPLLAPYDPEEQLDPVAGRHRPPGTRMAAVELRDGGWLLADRAENGPVGLRLQRLGSEEIVAPERIANLTADGVADERLFLLGSDRYGRDLSSRILYGARVSLLIGLLAAAMALGLGVAVGALAATGGPVTDSLLMRFVDAMLAFPRLFLLLALTALFEGGFALMVLVLGGTSWMGASRLVRAEMLALQQRDYVLAARAAGLSRLRILLRHLLPNALTPVVVDVTMRVGEIILLEAALSFLGLGVQPPTPSWGNMVADGRDVLVSAWWVSSFPGAALAATVLSLNLLGDGLRDRFDPRRARRRQAA